MQKFSEIIIGWYQKNKRDLPWRNTTDPYFVWLSEIILQQTRVDQGLPYYNKFVDAFPSIQILANASQDEVLRLWQGLGYYSRGRNLHYTAKQVVEDFNSKFPSDYNKLLKLKGIGAYTAAAIASFSGNEHRAVVDGNVYRVLSRFFGIDDDINLAASQKKFQHLALQLLSKKNPGKHNQAIMEFGALQCVPKNPNCKVCPLQTGCYALTHNKIGTLPYKSKKVKVKNRYFNYIVINDKNQTYIKRRKSGDIWEGLYEFPLIETKDELNENLILNSDEFEKLINGNQYKVGAISQLYKHKLTHQTIFCRFIEVEIIQITNKVGMEGVLWSDLDDYPKPALIQRFYLNN